MEPGDSVLVLRWAANYDEREFDEPLTVRLDRRPNRHGSFGLGPHRCAGSHFARAVLQVMVGRVLTRIPHYVVDEDRVADRRRDRFGIPSAVHCVYPVSGPNESDPMIEEGDEDMNPRADAIVETWFVPEHPSREKRRCAL